MRMKDKERTTQDEVHQYIKIYLRNAGDRQGARKVRKLKAERMETLSKKKLKRCKNYSERRQLQEQKFNTEHCNDQV